MIMIIIIIIILEFMLRLLLEKLRCITIVHEKHLKYFLKL